MAAEVCRAVLSCQKPGTADGVVNNDVPRRRRHNVSRGGLLHAAEFIQEIPGRDQLHHGPGERLLFTPLKGITFDFGQRETCPVYVEQKFIKPGTAPDALLVLLRTLDPILRLIGRSYGKESIMFRLLIPCLIWLTSVRSDTGIQMHIQGSAMPEKIGVSDDQSMLKAKRDSFHPPCPPIYSHVPAYPPQALYVKPYVAPIYPKKEVSVHQVQSQIQYIHQPTYAAVVPKQTVTYLKSGPASVVVKPYVPVVSQPKLIYQKPMISYAPVYHKPMISYAQIYQKPMLSYAPVYQKPVYYSPMYQKPMLYVKKYEAPVTQVVYQKPVAYHAPKVVEVQAPQISYVKAPHPVPMVHPAPVYLPAPTHAPILVKPHCP
ncbi:hypothetical protein KM043_018361 [Ampulex compressa]|nr:hypothetical protein KM043_018361 [Ampulex compressa]